MPLSSIGRLPLLLIIITPAMWSANYLVARYAPGIDAPHLLAFLRWSMAFCLMLPFAWPELRREWPQWRREWKEMIFLGALGMWICGAFVYIGGETTAALNIGLLYALAPVLIAIASAWVLKDRLKGLQLVGLLLAVAGVLIVVSKGSWHTIVSVDFTVGDIWVIIAVISWTIYSVVLKQRASVLGSFARVTVITAGGLLVLLPFTLAEIAVTGLPTDMSMALFIGAIAAILPGFGAYQAYAYLQQKVGAARAGLVLYLGPLYTGLLGWWVLGEPPQWYHLLGAVLIIPGMYLAMSIKSTATTQRAK